MDDDDDDEDESTLGGCGYVDSRKSRKMDGLGPENSPSAGDTEVNLWGMFLLGPDTALFGGESSVCIIFAFVQSYFVIS